MFFPDPTGPYHGLFVHIASLSLASVCPSRPGLSPRCPSAPPLHWSHRPRHVWALSHIAAPILPFKAVSLRRSVVDFRAYLYVSGLFHTVDTSVSPLHILALFRFSHLQYPPCHPVSSLFLALLSFVAPTLHPLVLHQLLVHRVLCVFLDKSIYYFLPFIRRSTGLVFVLPAQPLCFSKWRGSLRDVSPSPRDRYRICGFPPLPVFLTWRSSFSFPRFLLSSSGISLHL